MITTTNAMLFIILIISASFLNFCSSCKFQAHVRSETEHDVWAQFTFHNKSTGDVLKFSKYGETKTLTVSGELCGMAPTTLKSYDEYPKKGVKPVGETSAHLEGDGEIYYKIFPKDGPRAVRSKEMLCGWGQCRLGK